MQIIKSLTEFRNKLNIDRNMTTDQISMCAEAIIDSNEFYMLRPEDFNLCFNYAATGQYGEFYGRLDQPMVFGFIRKYSIERDAAISRKREGELDRSNIYDIFGTETMQKILTDVHDKLKIKEAPKPQEQPRERKKDVYQLCMDEFDELCKVSTIPNSPIRMTVYHEKMVDLDGFMRVRIVEMLDELEKDAI